MRRLLLMSGIAFVIALLPALLAAEGTATKADKKISFKLTAPTAQTTIENKQLVLDGPVMLVSPKNPPHQLTLNCLHLEANSASANNVTSVTATRNVTFTTYNMEKSGGQKAGSKSTEPVRYDGFAEKMILDIEIDPDTKKPHHILRMLKAKDSNGNEVQPKIVMTQQGQDPTTMTAPEMIRFDLEKQTFKSTGIIVESEN